ncbi:hypothetical protein N7493_009132 [Penicillium malachiteum]|uniref:Uncharacterized protein n=1 Tax=Penicillium malachiteum TaxID=1324776 RepID=A0AAD6HFX7_9EURO|nr:hypothetical protein N7493_009132 [Penicillium malachiteum]
MLAERPASKKARRSSDDLYPIHHDASDNKRKLIYQHDPTKPNPFHGRDPVNSEPLSQIPEEPAPRSLPNPSKESSGKEYNKGKTPIREDPITSAQYGQTYEGPGAGSSIQDSRNPYPDLPPLSASVEDGLSRSRPTNNVVSDRSHEARISGQGDPITFEPSGQTLEDRPSSSTGPEISTTPRQRWYSTGLTGDENIYLHPADMRASIIAASRESFDNAQSSDDSDTCENETGLEDFAGQNA